MSTIKSNTVWLRYAFLLPISGTERTGAQRKATSAAYKFTNTSLGGNYAINNPPQFTHFADIRQPGLGRKEEDWKEGMGRYYSEAIDDPKQMVHMTFGVPKFSSWTSFFTNFYDKNAAMLANTGSAESWWYTAGLITGYVVSLPLQPFIIGFTAVSRVFNFLAKNSPSKWYYFQPTMHAYWSAVNTIANELAINMGIIPRVFGSSQSDLENKDDQARLTNNSIDIKQMHAIYPSLFREDGGIDVMVLARRTEMMAYRAREAIKEIGDTSANVEAFTKNIKAYFAGTDQKLDVSAKHASTAEYFQAYVNSVRPASTNGDLDQDNKFSKWTDLNGLYDFITSSQRDGSQFVTFRVNHTGSMSESFSNSTRESDVAQAMNAKVSQGRSSSFNFMGGNVGFGLGDVIDAAKQVGAGVLDSMHLSGLATLTGTAFIDIPKMWSESTAELPRASYTIPLPNPYGNPISRYMNLMIPIAMIMAGGLPLSAGRSAYTSPFICQIYHQGRVQCQLGLIDSISINRGTGNVGWNAESQMLGAEITFSVIDLSSIMHVPIKGGFGDKNFIDRTVSATAQTLGNAVAGTTGQAVGAALSDGTVWDEQSTFSDYMSILSSMSLADIYYVGNRLNLNITRSVRSFETWKSPSNFLSWGLDTQPARMLSAFAGFSERF